MDSKRLKIIILCIVGMIAVLLILIQQLIMTKDLIHNQEEQRKQQQEQANKNNNIVVSELKETKTYNNFISKIDNNNIYIDMEVNSYGNIIVATKNNKLYVSTGNMVIIYKDNNSYVIDNEQKIISEKKDYKIEIRDILNIPSVDRYNEVKVEKSNEDIEEKSYYCETINNLKYYFENEKIVYIRDIEEDNLYKINNITEEIDEQIFNLPLEYSIIDGSSINNII